MMEFVTWDDDIPNTIWLFNIAMENGPFIVDFTTKTSIYSGFSHKQMVIFHSYVTVYQRVYGKNNPAMFQSPPPSPFISVSRCPGAS